jgi:hypothetical protein
MRPQNGGRPSPRNAGDGLPIERLPDRLDDNPTAQDSAPQPPEASPDITATLDQLRLGYVGEALDFVTSLATSGRETRVAFSEAVWRAALDRCPLALEKAEAAP